MKKIIVALLALCLVFSVAAQGPKAGGGGGSGGGDASPEVERSGAEAAPAYSSGEASRVMDRLRLKTEERERIRQMLEEQEGELVRVRAELREMQARMTRLMLEERVNRQEVERTLRQSMELELRMRMIQAERNIRLKEMLGPERWAAMYRLAQMVQAAERAGKLDDFIAKSENPAQIRAMLQILQALF